MNPPRRRGGAYSSGRPRAPSVVAGGPTIFGVGIDVLQISRVAHVDAAHPERFAARLLHPSERERLSQVKDRTVYLAKCFAVKEAFVKALGTGFRGIAHDDVGLGRGPLGRTQLVLSVKARALMSVLGAGEAHVNLSDERDYVVAVVVLERA
jgi:holo-[acyl-carrier protein] synthase